MSRFQELLRSMPPTTLGIVGLCCVLYAFQITADLPLNQFALCPRYVLYLREYYRIITSAVFHGSLMHIGMNMMSAAAIGAMLEKRLGTIRLLVTILWSTILTSVLYIVAALLMSGLLGNDGLMYRHSIGFSGVVFHLSVLESNLGPHRSRSVFGAISVPAHLYPWVLLVVLQWVMPNLSFGGHLAGILVGTLQLYGLLNFVLLGEETLRGMDNWEPIQRFTSRPSFVATTSSRDTVAGDLSSLRQAVGRGLQTVSTFVRNVLDAIRVIIFGRGRAANANIQLPSWTPLAASDGVDEDDEDWSGLPDMPSGPRESQTV